MNEMLKMLSLDARVLNKDLLEQDLLTLGVFDEDSTIATIEIMNQIDSEYYADADLQPMIHFFKVI